MYKTVAAALTIIFILVFFVYPLKGGSMQPYSSDGDLTLCVPSTDYVEGDVVMYVDEHNRSVFHRIVWNKGVFYLMKGDSNDLMDDELVEREQIFCESRLIVPTGEVLYYSSD